MHWTSCAKFRTFRAVKHKLLKLLSRGFFCRDSAHCQMSSHIYFIFPSKILFDKKLQTWHFFTNWQLLLSIYAWGSPRQSTNLRHTFDAWGSHKKHRHLQRLYGLVGARNPCNSVWGHRNLKKLSSTRGCSEDSCIPVARMTVWSKCEFLIWQRKCL